MYVDYVRVHSKDLAAKLVNGKGLSKSAAHRNAYGGSPPADQGVRVT